MHSGLVSVPLPDDVVHIGFALGGFQQWSDLVSSREGFGHEVEVRSWYRWFSVCLSENLFRFVSEGGVLVIRQYPFAVDLRGAVFLLVGTVLSFFEQPLCFTIFHLCHGFSDFVLMLLGLCREELANLLEHAIGMVERFRSVLWALVGQQRGFHTEEVRVELVRAIGVLLDQVTVRVEGFVPVLPLELGIRDLHGDIISDGAGWTVEPDFIHHPFAVVLGVVQRLFIVRKVDVVEFVWKLKPVMPDRAAPLVDSVLIASARVLFEQFEVIVFGLGIVFREIGAFGGHEIGVLFEGAAHPVLAGIDVFFPRAAKQFSSLGFVARGCCFPKNLVSFSVFTAG